tara:strand:- start:207 stop:386 length:180 start_codon:yes stop_codon:yes gene_type:complete
MLREPTVKIGPIIGIFFVVLMLIVVLIPVISIVGGGIVGLTEGFTNSNNTLSRKKRTNY